MIRMNQNISRGQGQTIIDLIKEQNKRFDDLEENISEIKEDIKDIKEDISDIADATSMKRNRRGQLVKSA